MANNLKISAVGLASLLAAAAFAQTATTDPVGFVASGALPSSDTRISMSLEREAAFSGAVSAVSGAVLTVSGSPAWTANKFQYVKGVQSNTYYVRLASGAKAGAVFTVTGNGASTVTVDLNGDTLAGVVSGDRLEVVPYWTLGTVLPASAANTAFEPTDSALNRKTEVLFPNLSYVGVNPPTPNVYYFMAGFWRRAGSSSTDVFDDTPIPHDGYVVVRNKGFTGRIVVVGGVVTERLALFLNSEASAKQDNIVALLRPVPVSLNDSGLISSGAFTASGSALSIKDQLLVFNDAAAGFNKAASAIYYYMGGAWRKAGFSTDLDFGGEMVFQPNSGVIIRKAPNGVGSVTQTWNNNPTY